MADVCVGLLSGRVRLLNELKTLMGVIVPTAGGFDTIIEGIPGEVVAETRRELPFGREMPMGHQGQLDGKAVMGIIGGMVVAVIVEGGTDRDAQVDGGFGAVSVQEGVGLGVETVGKDEGDKGKDDSFHGLWGDLR